MARFRDNRPQIVKGLPIDPEKQDELYEMASTPAYLSQFINGVKSFASARIDTGLIMHPTQNRAYRRMIRKPLRPNNIRRLSQDKQRTEQLAAQEYSINQARKKLVGTKRG